jgi:hypothetical protein
MGNGTPKEKRRTFPLAGSLYAHCHAVATSQFPRVEPSVTASFPYLQPCHHRGALVGARGVFSPANPAVHGRGSERTLGAFSGWDARFGKEAPCGHDAAVHCCLPQSTGFVKTRGVGARSRREHSRNWTSATAAFIFPYAHRRPNSH